MKTGLHDINGVEIQDGDVVICVYVEPEIPKEWVTHQMRGIVELDRKNNWVVSLDPNNEPPELSNHWTPLWPPEHWQVMTPNERLQATPGVAPEPSR